METNAPSRDRSVPAGGPAAWDPTFRSVAEATTDKVGVEFLRLLVKHLALSLDVRYAFVAELAGSPERVRTVALWGGDSWLDDVEYDLAGTPCEEVARGDARLHPDGVQQRFPDDLLLAEMKVRSYFGVPLRAASGETLGHLAVLDTEPLPDGDEIRATVGLFADRARVELERVRSQAALERAGRDLQFRLERTALDLEHARDRVGALVEIHRAVAGHLDRAGLFTAVAAALRRVIPADRVVLLLPDTDPSVLSVFAAHGAGEIKVLQGERIPCEGSVPGWVVVHGRPFVVDRASDIERSYPVTHEKLVREGMNSVAVVPLLNGGRCIGALGLMSESAEAWSGIQVELLEEVAAAVAVAVDHCVAYEELGGLHGEQAALLGVNRTVARHLRRDELFAALAVCLRDLLPSDRFGIETPAGEGRLRSHLFEPHATPIGPPRVAELPAEGTACRWTETNRQWLVTSSRAELGDRFPITLEVMTGERMHSLCTMPLLSDERCLGVLFFMSAREGAYKDLRRGMFDQVASAVAVALDNCLAYEELRTLRDRLARENVYLQDEIRQEHNFREIVGQSAALLELLSQVERVAPTDSGVVILGETGTGKELIARALHDRSHRRERPLVKVNCSAIPTALVESELFGHVKGAFTGAVSHRIGRFELADGGTIFLDEIGDLPPETQVKLLRVLQEREFEAVGSSQTRKIDVRVIAATNRDLRRAVEAGSFRADLFYRLNVMPIRVPALRERREDVPLLVRHFLERHARDVGKPIDGVSKATMDRLVAYDWPGNVRELENLMERAVILASGSVLELDAELLPIGVPGPDLAIPPGAASAVGRGGGSLDAMQRSHIAAMLERSGWVIEGDRGAARKLGLHPNTLRSRMKKLGLRRP